MRRIVIIFLIAPLHILLFSLFHFCVYRHDATSYSLSSEIALKAQLDEEKTNLYKILTMKECKDILAYFVTHDLPKSLKISTKFNMSSTNYEGKFGKFHLSFNSIQYVEFRPLKSNQNIDRIEQPKFLNSMSVYDGQNEISIVPSETPYVVTNLDLFIKDEAKKYQQEIFSV